MSNMSRIEVSESANISVVRFQDQKIIDPEAILELGRSFWPAPVYALVWAGYRWRTENESIRRKPGDERILGNLLVPGVLEVPEVLGRSLEW